MLRWVAILFLTLSSLSGRAQELSENLRFVMHALHLHPDSCATQFISEKKMPGTADQLIMVIPEYTWLDEERYHFEIVGHVVLLNTSTKKFLHIQVNSEVWYSDAMVLSDISIDTAPYFVGKNERAFGVRLKHNGSSRANPYNTEHLTLFIEEEGQLLTILDDFQTMHFDGEYGYPCASQSTEKHSILIMDEYTQQDFANIRVKSTQTNSLSFTDENGECQEESCSFSYTILLTFDGSVYRPMY